MNKVSYPRNKVLGGIWGLIIGDAVGVHMNLHHRKIFQA